MQKTISWVLAVVVIAAGWYIWNGSSTDMQSESTETPAREAVDTDSETVVPSASVVADSEAAANAVVTYDGKSYSPSSVTIKQGGTVTFTSTAGNMWVASNPHPSHEGYSGTTKNQHCPDTAGTAFDQCSSGTSYTFTFQKTGSWGYHNHSNAGASGMVNVE